MWSTLHTSLKCARCWNVCELDCCFKICHMPDTWDLGGLAVDNFMKIFVWFQVFHFLQEPTEKPLKVTKIMKNYCYSCWNTACMAHAIWMSVTLKICISAVIYELSQHELGQHPQQLRCEHLNFGYMTDCSLFCNRVWVFECDILWIEVSGWVRYRGSCTL